jgi:hypothetical protein
MYILADDSIKSAATLAVTSTAAGFAVDNLKNDKRAATWRSTAITSQTITATWSSPQTVDAVGVAFANFLIGSTLRVRLFTNVGDASPVVDSGIKTLGFVYPPPHGFTANNLASFAYGGGNYYFLKLVSSSIKKMEVMLTNPAGIDAFIEVSRIVAGAAYHVQYGMDFGGGVVLDDLTQTRRTDGGNTIVDRRPVSKSVSLDLSMLTPADRVAMQKIVRRNGLHTPVFISAYESAADSSIRADFQIYGHFKDLSGLSLVSAAYSSIRLRVEEI